RGQVWRVGRFGAVLGRKAERVALPVGPAARALKGAVEEVAGVELHAGLGGVDGERAAGATLPDLRSELEAAAVEHEVVVVSASADELFVSFPDPLADRVRTGEVERRVLDRSQLAGGDEGGVDRRVAFGVVEHEVVVNVR